MVAKLDGTHKAYLRPVDRTDGAMGYWGDRGSLRPWFGSAYTPSPHSTARACRFNLMRRNNALRWTVEVRREWYSEAKMASSWLLGRLQRKIDP